MQANENSSIKSKFGRRQTVGGALAGREAASTLSQGECIGCQCPASVVHPVRAHLISSTICSWQTQRRISVGSRGKGKPCCIVPVEGQPRSFL
jgi:hypothetical protein